MDKSPPTVDSILDVLRIADRETIDRRLAEIEAEKRALATLRRAIVRRDRELQRQTRGGVQC